MLVPGGVFWGYRELVIIAGGGLQVGFPEISEWISRVEQWDLDEMDEIPYQYRAFAGDAPNAFAATYTQIGFEARMIRLTVKDNWIDLRLSYQGEPAMVDMEKMRNLVNFQAVTAFNVRNKVSGSVGKYQLSAWR